MHYTFILRFHMNFKRVLQEIAISNVISGQVYEISKGVIPPLCVAISFISLAHMNLHAGNSVWFTRLPIIIS